MLKFTPHTADVWTLSKVMDGNRVTSHLREFSGQVPGQLGLRSPRSGEFLDASKLKKPAVFLYPIEHQDAIQEGDHIIVDTHKYFVVSSPLLLDAQEETAHVKVLLESE